MYKLFGLIASAYGIIAVILGAFGAHALKTKLDDYQHQIYDKAVHYQFFHIVALMAVFLLSKSYPSKALNLSGWFFTIGTLLFSGSLYLLATRHLLGLDNFAKVLGPVTPLGGLSFIFGWVLLFVAILKIKG